MRHLCAWFTRLKPRRVSGQFFLSAQMSLLKQKTISLRGRLPKLLMTAALIGGSAATLFAGSAKAAWTDIDGVWHCGGADNTLYAQCDTTTTAQLGDKVLQLTQLPSVFVKNDSFSFALNPATQFLPEFWQVSFDPEPNRVQPNADFYDYKLSIVGSSDVFSGTALSADVNPGGTTNIQKCISSAAGSPPSCDLLTQAIPPDPNPLTGFTTIPGNKTTIYVRDGWNINGNDGANINQIRNSFTQSTVPGPLPLLGAGAAFGFSRRIRRRIKGVNLA